MIESVKEKCWGTTKKVFSSEMFSVHELELKSGGFCSFHYHKHRANRFVVKSGKVRIVWSIGTELFSVDLTSENTWMIRANIPHQFQVLRNSTMFEEYILDSLTETMIDDSDIVRISTGSNVVQISNNIGIYDSDGVLRRELGLR